MRSRRSFPCSFDPLQALQASSEDRPLSASSPPVVILDPWQAGSSSRRSDPCRLLTLCVRSQLPGAIFSGAVGLVNLSIAIHTTAKPRWFSRDQVGEHSAALPGAAAGQL